MAHSGTPAERGGEVALKKPSHHTLARLWLDRACPDLSAPIYGAISLDRITLTLRCNLSKRKYSRSSNVQFRLMLRGDTLNSMHT